MGQTDVSSIGDGKPPFVLRRLLVGRKQKEETSSLDKRGKTARGEKNREVGYAI